MDEMNKTTLERTRGALLRHLEDLNDEVDQHDGRICDPLVLDGIKDSLESLECLNGMMAEPASTATVKAVAVQPLVK